jgi:putative salt-induced outer membrane protein
VLDTTCIIGGHFFQRSLQGVPAMAVRAIAMGVMVTLCALSAPAHAEWKGKGSIGASVATGNSENQAFSGALELKNELDNWQHTLGIAGNYGNDGDVATSQRWEARAQTQHDFTARAYTFGAVRHEDDRFSNFAFQSSISAGLGYKLIDRKRTKLWVQGGPGYRYAELQSSGESAEGMILRGDLGFEHQLTDTTRIVERFLVESSSDNTYLQSDLGMEVTITGSLGLRIGYQVRHNTDVQPAVESTDTLSTVGLLYETR